MSDGIDLILADHRVVEALFTSLRQTGGAGIGQIIDALTAHDDAEHGALYPLAGEVLGDALLIEKMASAHSRIQQQIDRVSAREGADLLTEVAELEKLVKAHVADEERDLLPALRKKATPDQLATLGARIRGVKQRVG
jgi:hemerythrin superfamily protein